MMERRQNMQLTCEYLHTPIGIQNPAPRFGWRVTEEYCKTIQEAYQIYVYDSSNHCVWDSNKVVSSQCSAIEYAGMPLSSFLEYRWQVTLWLRDMQNTKSEIQIQAEDTFEMGILNQNDWQGEWIWAKEMPTDAVPLFRREFIVEKIPNKARVYLSGIGYCEAWINGKKLGDAFLDPGWTNYNKTVLYRIYDVTSLLQEGKNIFSAELGGGWLTLDHEAFVKMIGRQTPWLSEPKLLCNIYLDDQCIATGEDGTWMYSDGPIRSHNLYDGEYYDASKEKKGYHLPSYLIMEEEWKKASAAKEPGGILRSQIMPPIRKVLERDPQYIEYIGEVDDYSMTVDFGVNFSGWVTLSATGKPGQKIRIRYGETLCQDHSVNQRNMREAKAEDVFTFGAEERITYQPHFAYHGFRYAQIIMDPGVVIDEVKGCEVHTDVNRIGTFSCSNKILNDIQEAIQLTEINNLHSVPTDCPQRDERLGWMNDMTVRYEEGLYNFDMMLFYEKWLQDIEDEQRDDGAIPDTVPYFFGDLPARHISSVFLLVPWNLYLFYGDIQILKRHYAGMKKYLQFKLSERGDNGILPDEYFGDWAPPMTEAFLGWGENAVPKNLTQSFMTTCYLYYDCKVMEKVGTVLQQKEDVLEYQKKAQEVQQDLNRCFLKSEGYYDTGSQGCNVFPLFLDIVPEEEKERVRTHLIDDLVKKHNYHITTGNQMTKYLYEVLNQEGMDEVAFQVASSETYPSIGFMLKNGATTIWERWENLTNKHMNSHSHPMLGAFTVWFYKGLAGIRLNELHSRRLTLRPAIIEQLDYAEASHEFCWGKCSVRWEKEEQEIVYSFEIPWNMTATLDLSKCTVSFDKILCGDTEIRCEELANRIFTSGSYQIKLITKKA